MNKIRRKNQEMDLSKVDWFEQPITKTDKKWNKVEANKRVIWMTPFPSREERRVKIKKRSWYTRRWREISKITNIWKRIKQKSSFFNKVKKYIWL